jgi:protein CpxP
MIFKSLRGALFGATILALGGAGVAFAQAPAKPAAMGEHHMGHDPAAMMQRHAQKLRDALQLTPAQEPALQALLTSMKPPEGMGGHMGMKEDHEAMAKMTTPQRLEKMHARMTEHMAAFDQHAQAVTKFYAQLTPAQQKAFDALTPMMIHRGMGGMRGEHGMDHEMGGHEMGDHDMGGHEKGGHEMGGHPAKPPGA